CGLVIFTFLVLRGGHDHIALYGCLAMTPGFVAILGWRIATLFLGLLAVFTGIVFFADLYLFTDQAFPLLLEVKFFISFLGLGLFSLGHGYAWEKSFQQLLHTNRRVNALAYKDPLTVLPNRRLMEDLLVQRWEEYKRSGHVFAVLLCNIDDFKRLNDLYGRDFCDGVLVRIANVLAKSLRSQDVISRWSGDEFLVILPGQTQATALKVAERLRRRVEEIQLAIFNQPVAVSISVGVTGVEAALSAADIISMADAGLYQAKHRGKNRVMSA
ncbi:MAG: GGDEF domain-containing protein, partial [Porticoccaceae bacterium]